VLQHPRHPIHGGQWASPRGEGAPQIAAAYEAGAVRQHTATELRTAAMRTLHAERYGWTQTRVAEAIVRNIAAVNRALNAVA